MPLKSNSTTCSNYYLFSFLPETIYHSVRILWGWYRRQNLTVLFSETSSLSVVVLSMTTFVQANSALFYRSSWTAEGGHPTMQQGHWENNRPDTCFRNFRLYPPTVAKCPQSCLLCSSVLLRSMSSLKIFKQIQIPKETPRFTISFRWTVAAVH